MTDWRKPFDRYATVIYVHKTSEVFWERSSNKAHIRIAGQEWAWLESKRQEWLVTYKEYIQQLEDERQKEIALMLQRKAIRDSQEAEAEIALQTISKWKKYVDRERWFELNEWFESHPQRITEEDNVFILLDDVDWNDPIPALESWSEVQEKVKLGRPKGTKNSEKAIAHQSAAAKKHWKKLRSEGWIHPTKENKEHQIDS